jgi:hypothetical protein
MVIGIAPKDLATLIFTDSTGVVRVTLLGYNLHKAGLVDGCGLSLARAGWMI